jgi:hypothetical protein
MEQVTLPLSGLVVSVPTTGRDWQLYSSMPNKRAARALTTALMKALKVVDKGAKDGFRPSERLLEDLYEKLVYPVMLKHRDVGAADTEPRSVAWTVLQGAGPR